MPSVYILKSLKNGTLYVGMTDRTPEERLEEHNAGKTQGIGNRLPFIIIRTEIYPSFALAMRRERFLKTGKGRRILTGLLANTRLAWKDGPII